MTPLTSLSDRIIEPVTLWCKSRLGLYQISWFTLLDLQISYW